MHYRINHTTKYTYADAVAVCHNVVRLAPRELAHQRVGEYRLIVVPEPADIVERVDAFGNRVGYFSIEQAHHGLSLSATSEIEVDQPPTPEAGPAWEAVRDALPAAGSQETVAPQRFAFASPLVPIDPRLADYARRSFTPGRPIVDALAGLTAQINEEFDYDPVATTVTTPVLEAFEKRAGVCQDFAHIQIACLRSLGLAARYVSGYLRTHPPEGKPRLVGADASHAWLSLYCGDTAGEGDSASPLWIDTDPTNNQFAGADYVTVALGRDYADVCPIQGVYVGGGNHSMSVSVDVAPQGK